MNDVVNPFQITHPTAIQTSLLASALFSKFDPSGRWIAAGKQNGSVVIWDLNTRAPVRVLDGHVRGVTSVDWSRYGRYVLTSSKDWNVIVWDLAERLTRGAGCLQRMKTVRFDSSVISAGFHPRNSKIILVLLATGELFITDLRTEYRGRVELYDTLFQIRERELRDRERERDRGREREKLEEGEEGEGSSPVPPPSLPPQREATRSPITVARFDISGRYVFAGTANGMLLVFNTRTKAMVGRHKIAGVGAMKSLDFTRNGRRLVTNSSDRTLRQFTIPNYQVTSSHPSTNNLNTSSSSIPTLATATTALIVNEQELEPTHRFNDPINRTAWHVMAYSPDGEWLAGGSADPATHKIYIWDLSNDGQFSTALDGGREPLAHIHWHPAKSLIASTTTHGNILIWHCPKAERWGAFAGGFEEADENINYEEREDEFDIEDEEMIRERKMKAEEQAVDVNSMDISPDTSPIVPKRSLNTSGTSSSSTTTAATGVGSGASKSSTTSASNITNNATQSKSNSNSNSKSANTNTSSSSNTKGKNSSSSGKPKVVDEDAAWADEDEDEDMKGWKMHVSKGVAELAEELGV